jgi:hypothetical protein
MTKGWQHVRAELRICSAAAPSWRCHACLPVCLSFEAGLRPPTEPGARLERRRAIYPTQVCSRPRSPGHA